MFLAIVCIFDSANAKNSTLINKIKRYIEFKECREYNNDIKELQSIREEDYYKYNEADEESGIEELDTNSPIEYAQFVNNILDYATQARINNFKSEIIKQNIHGFKYSIINVTYSGMNFNNEISTASEYWNNKLFFAITDRLLIELNGDPVSINSILKYSKLPQSDGFELITRLYKMIYGKFYQYKEDKVSSTLQLLKNDRLLFEIELKNNQVIYTKGQPVVYSR